MITGSHLIDALAFVVVGWVGAILILPIAQWIEYKRDCKKHGKEWAYEKWRKIKKKKS